MLNLIQNLFKIFGIKVSRIVEEVFPVELSEKTTKILKEVEPFTMTSQARLTSLALSVNYINESGIAGDIVECGVWAGGSIAAAIKIDKQFKSARKYWLYDTFEGMTVPSIQDPEKAHSGYQERKTVTGGSAWCNVDQTTVKRNLENLGVDLTDCIFVAGDVADTLSSIKPKSIALLRLDTDWYESTKIELQQLWPLLTVGGVLILDDYGYWDGARSAVEEFFSHETSKPLLIPIDHAGRICVKR